MQDSYEYVLSSEQTSNEETAGDQQQEKQQPLRN